jgi:hypothetical protein
MPPKTLPLGVPKVSAPTGQRDVFEVALHSPIDVVDMADRAGELMLSDQLSKRGVSLRAWRITPDNALATADNV